MLNTITQDGIRRIEQNNWHIYVKRLLVIVVLVLVEAICQIIVKQKSIGY
jgi:hypothetical protein